MLQRRNPGLLPGGLLARSGPFLIGLLHAGRLIGGGVRRGRKGLLSGLDSACFATMGGASSFGPGSASFTMVGIWDLALESLKVRSRTSKNCKVGQTIHGDQVITTGVATWRKYTPSRVVDDAAARVGRMC